jgi:hypothetical protein
MKAKKDTEKVVKNKNKNKKKKKQVIHCFSAVSYSCLRRHWRRDECWEK